MKKVVITAAVIMAMLLLSACASPSILQNENLGVTEEADKEMEPVASPMDVQEAEGQPGDVDEEDRLPMYSSFAYMRSFNPETGIAQFDYFEMLKGPDAVDYLINYEGYCSLVAETEIEKLGEDDFMEKNLGFELRQINLKKVPVLLLYTADGCSITDARGAETSFGDIVSLYNKDKTKLLLSSYYYITVDEDMGEVLMIEQVRKP